MAETDRQRLRPWLIGQIDRGCIPGLCWLNVDRTKFKIPWKHAGNKDWVPSDGQIFKVAFVEVTNLTTKNQVYWPSTFLPNTVYIGCCGGCIGMGDSDGQVPRRHRQSTVREMEDSSTLCAEQGA